MNAFEGLIAEREYRGSAEEQKRGTQGFFPEPLCAFLRLLFSRFGCGLAALSRRS
jgi:hypothetical protein